MNVKKEIKESLLHIRINTDTKRAFKLLAERRQTTMSKILLEYIEGEIKNNELNYKL